jgi:histidinol phosphatase-like enzyme (inositol monophosphatase family)
MNDIHMQAAADVARLAGNVAATHFRTAVAVETKADGSPVTIADRTAEQAARQWLERRFPNDGILGEEYGERGPKAGRRWIIDPIDGTKSFIRGVPLWGTLVALCEGSVVLAGAAFFPMVSELVVAAPGQGTWWNGVRCAVSRTEELRAATVLTTDVHYHDQHSRREGWRALAAAASIARTWGDAYGYLLVATGRADAMVDAVMNPWDAAPFLPIIEEAGGVFTDWSGARTVFGGSAIATNRALAGQVRETLQAGPVREVAP